MTRAKGRMTPLQRAYLLGYSRALTQARREIKATVRDMKRGWEEEIAELKDALDGIERDYANAGSGQGHG